MDADFSIELGREDPVLDFPWTDPRGEFVYRDLKGHPERVAQLPEARQFPELGELLVALNSAGSPVETAKCDAWTTAEMDAEEEIYEARYKIGSYVDVVFCNGGDRYSFSAHEQFARRVVGLLGGRADPAAAAEVCLRRCFFAAGAEVREGFYCTLHVHGYGQHAESARRNWGAALRDVEAAILGWSPAGDLGSSSR
jgi:hypothetical protein